MSALLPSCVGLSPVFICVHSACASPSLLFPPLSRVASIVEYRAGELMFVRKVSTQKLKIVENLTSDLSCQ